MRGAGPSSARVLAASLLTLALLARASTAAAASSVSYSRSRSTSLSDSVSLSDSYSYSVSDSDSYSGMSVASDGESKSSSGNSSSSVWICVQPATCDDPCACARSNSEADCFYHLGLIDYEVFTYCALGKDLQWLSLVLMALWLLFLTYMLLSTTDQFYCETMAKLSDCFGLSPYIAGVVFLSIGNSAPTVFVATSAVSHGAPQLATNVVIGSGLFLMMVVLGCIAFFKEKLSISRRPFFRDTAYYTLSMMVLTVLLYLGRIFTWGCIVIFVAFLIYMSALIAVRFVRQLKIKRNTESSHRLLPDPSYDIQDDDELSPILNEVVFLANFRGWGPRNRSSPIRTSPGYQGTLVFHGDLHTPSRFTRFFQRFSSAIRWDDKTRLQKAVYIFFAPSVFIRHCSIPPLSMKYFGATFSLATSCILGPLLALLASQQYLVSFEIGDFDVPLWFFFLVVGVILAPIMCLACRYGASSYVYSKVVVFPALLCSGLWLYLVACEFIAVILSFGQILGLTSSILGLTVIPWGTSIIDLISNVIISREGLPRIAIQGTYLSCIISFSFTFGFGGLIMAERLDHCFSVCLTSTILIAVGCLVLFVVLHGVVVPLCRFKLVPAYAIFLFVVYCGVTALEVLVELGELSLFTLDCGECPK
ncbi:sodium/calcium exchanger protein [Pelomyxa schiedti]|nr:sodium/calcium exchanger protein [Pelomyxa schiedti]